jgi:hypothetical protein
MSEQALQFRASIGSVLYRKSALEKMLDKKFNRMCNDISGVIDSSLEELGESVVEKAKDNIRSSTPSGGTYQIVNKKGKVLKTWTASSGGNPPAEITKALYKAIKYKKKSGGSRADFIEVGVFSDELWRWQTIAFYGAGKSGKSLKNHPYGRIVVGEGGKVHPIYKYAKAMEEGFTNANGTEVEPRPFLRPAFEEIVIQGRKNFQKKMNSIFNELFGEKVPVTFRIYVSKEFQESYK